jgi:CRP-like cAMP-binding protein
MSGEELIETLRGATFLDGLADEHLRALAGIAEQVNASEGSVVFREGDEHPATYLVVRGAVALEVRARGRETTRLQTVGPGEVLGWSPVLGRDAMTATARALAPAALLRFDAGRLLALCEADPRFGFEFMKRTARALSRRLTAARLQMLDVYRLEPSGAWPAPGGGHGGGGP